MTTHSQITADPLTADDIADLLSEAITDSIDMDWQAGDAVRCILKMLDREGLRIMPDLAKVAADGGYDYAAFNFYNNYKGWSCDLHRDGIVFSDGVPFKSSPEDALAATLIAEGFDATAYRAALEQEQAA